MLRLPVLAAVAALSLLSLGSSFASESGCFARKLIPAPASVNSGVFLDDGRTLLLADHLSQTLFPFALDGRVRSSLPPALVKVLKDLPPRSIIEHGDKLLVYVPSGRILTLGKDFSIRPQKFIATDQRLSKDKNLNLLLLGMYRWHPVGSDILAFSDLQPAQPQQRPLSAFVRFPADDPSAFKIQHKMDYQEPSKVFYQLGFPYIAALDNDGYAVSMENTIEIYRSHRSDEGELSWKALAADAVPEDFSRAPDLSDLFSAKGELASLMSAVEKSKMPVGLYGWNKYLYLLTREPDGRGTRWKLFKIDPHRERVVDSTVIPSRADHLTVIPGKKMWAFVEKGRVESWDRQRADSMLLVPSSRLKNKLPEMLCRPGELQR